MLFLRRILYIPIVVVFIGALLIIFNVINTDIVFPVSFEVLAMITGAILTAFAFMDVRATVASNQYPEPEDAPKSTKVIYPKVMEDAVEAFNEVEEFVVKANGRVEIEIDIEEDPEE